MTVILIIASILLDQITKYFAIEFVKPQGSVPLIDGVFCFTYHENRGAFLGAFADNRWVFLIASTVAILGMIIFLFKVKDNHILVRLSLAMLIGGGIGNMIDRVSLGYVVDFLDFELINFPIFNVADSFITVGGGILIFYLIFFEMRDVKIKKGRAADISDFDIPFKNAEEKTEEKADVIVSEAMDVSDDDGSKDNE